MLMIDSKNRFECLHKGGVSRKGFHFLLQLRRQLLVW